MDTSEECRALLARIADQPDEAIDLAGAALALAALDRPRVGLERYRRHLDSLASDLAREVGAAGGATADVRARLGALNRVMVELHGYEGDSESYDDLQNANLMRVIDRKKGLPVALGILYIHAARAQGWDMVGLAFPGHFVVRLEHAGERLIIDPFNKGGVREVAELRTLLKATAGADAELEPHLYAPVSNRDILIRLQNNVKLRLLRLGQVERAAAALDSILAFAPGRAELWHESGVIHARLGNLRAAVAALERALGLSAGKAERFQIAALLQELRAKLN